MPRNSLKNRVDATLVVYCMPLERISFNQFKNAYAISAFTQDQIIGGEMFDDIAEEGKRQFDRFCKTMRAAKMPPFVL